ncbi:MAG: ACP S-malonyltransferase [Pseudonocardiaceae bacterium]
MTLAYLFPGQGSHLAGMGVQLAEGSRAAAEVFSRASTALGYDLLKVCRDSTADDLRQTEVTQPALLATSLACLAAAADWLPPPSVVAGHSLGEYTALVAAGVIGLEQAVRLVRTRGLLMREVTEGRDLTMAAVLGLDAPTVEAFCDQPDTVARCWPAAYNSPTQTVVSGDRAAVTAVAALADDAGGRCTVLPVSSAFHTPLMTPVAARLGEVIDSAIQGAPRVPVICNVTGLPVHDPATLRSRLIAQLDQPVRWAQTMTQLRELGVRRVVELGPGRVLTRLARAFDRRMPAAGIDDPASLAAARSLLAPQAGAPRTPRHRSAATGRDDRQARYRREGYWAGQTLPEAILAAAARRPADQPALIGDSAVITYGALPERAAGMAVAFAAADVGPGDRVVVYLPNRPELALVLLALWQRAAVAVMALPGYREHELEHLARTSGARALVVGSRFRARREDPLAIARHVRDRVPGLATLLVLGNPAAPGELTDPADGEVAVPVTATAPTAPSQPCPADSLALLLVSGGSTGLPKLVPRTHDDYLYNARVSARICDSGPDTVYLAGLPAAHNFTLGCPGVVGTLLTGGSVVFSLRSEAGAIAEAISAHQVTATAAVPSLASAVAAYARSHGERLPSLRLLQVGGARLAPEPARLLLHSLDTQLQQVYGMAEGLLCFTRLTDPDDVVIHTQGRPASPADEIRIVDGNGAATPAGTAGELWTRGPYTITRYYPSGGTAVTDDGWYRTGDVVRLHPSGNLVVEGRLTDVINRGGEKVGAGEVEMLVARHPAVAEVAAVPADAGDTETICVVVVVSTGHDPPTLLELRRFLDGERVAPHKYPERLVVVDAMPRTPAGKPDKTSLRRLAAGLAGADA